VERIKVYGTKWCKDTILARQVLEQHGVNYEWIDIKHDPVAEKFVKETNQGYRSVPTILFPDKSILVEPSRDELIQKLVLLGL